MDFERSKAFEEKRRTVIKGLKDLIKICKNDDDIPEAVLEFYKNILHDMREEDYDLYCDDEDDEDDDDDIDQLVVTLGKNGVVSTEFIPKKEQVCTDKSGINEFCVNYSPVCKELIKFPDISNINPLCRFANKGICFTGFAHEEKVALEAIAKKLNISRKSSITSKVDFLICGNSPGWAKIAECKDRGIPIISAKDFINEIVCEVN